MLVCVGSRKRRISKTISNRRHMILERNPRPRSSTRHACIITTVEMCMYYIHFSIFIISLLYSYRSCACRGIRIDSPFTFHPLFLPRLVQSDNRIFIKLLFTVAAKSTSAYQKPLLYYAFLASPASFIRYTHPSCFRFHFNVFSHTA